MSPRPRTVDDQAILAATARAMSRVGPTRLTLADIAAEVGLSPATLVQRFGSKRGLLLALSEGALEYVATCFAAVRSAHRSPLDALVAAATEMSRYTQKPEEMANHLAWLQVDLSDPDFHRIIMESTKQSLAGYRTLLDEAVTAGELVPCDTSRLARAIGSISSGSLLAWAILREGTAESFVRRDLEALLAPYRPVKKPRAAPLKKKPRTKSGRKKNGEVVVATRG